MAISFPIEECPSLSNDCFDGITVVTLFTPIETVYTPIKSVKDVVDSICPEVVTDVLTKDSVVVS